MTRKERTRFCCNECGSVTAVWNGRCAGCGGWNTLEERAADGGRSSPDAPVGASFSLAEASPVGAGPVPTGVAEFDRVMAGGVAPGSITLLSGPPGVGKSTLALQLAMGAATTAPTASVLYVSAEETIAQVRSRADRMNASVPDAVAITEVADIEVVCSIIERERPGLVIVDSIQTVSDPQVASVPGSVGQVRGCAQRLAALARASGVSLVVIGHVTKDGQVAGPRQLEHLVDTVIGFDADLDHGLRFLRASKHRFGPVGELGVFRMDSAGLCGVPDAAGLFLQDRIDGVAGSVVVPALDGRRVMVSEVQALVGGPEGPPTVQLAQGVDRGRLGLVVAVLGRQAGLRGDVFCSVAGGARVTEPGADLAITIALASASTGAPVRASTVVCGEVGLVGEVRGVHAAPQRIREAARLGFERAIVPQATPEDVDACGIEVIRVGDVQTAIRAALDDVESSLTYRTATQDSQRIAERGPVEGAMVGAGDLRTLRDVGTIGM